MERNDRGRARHPGRQAVPARLRPPPRTPRRTGRAGRPAAGGGPRRAAAQWPADRPGRPRGTTRRPPIRGRTRWPPIRGRTRRPGGGRAAEGGDRRPAAPWAAWLRHRARTEQAVREQLAADGWITVEERRVLGLLPVRWVTVREPRVRTAPERDFSRALSGPASSVGDTDARVVALADAARLPTVPPMRVRHQHRARIAELARRSGLLPRVLPG
ncbi:GPP34 family phosphoprotein [Kitasatospora sp. NPDC088346]|uniref:GPP34 family phosphoprotein n=1 Tax=Kitasatospora sp. NPDC088346 TaxID=3364073 RepID=UPI003805DCA3